MRVKARATSTTSRTTTDGGMLSLATGRFGAGPPKRRRALPTARSDGTGHSISVGWDNYQMLRSAKHETEHHGRKFMMFGVTFAVKHRLPSLHLDDVWVKEAKTLPPWTWLPSAMDMTLTRKRMVTLVTRILVRRIPALAELQAHVVWHLPHPRTREMTQQSEVINLGVVDADPASNAGVTTIMQHLQETCPTVTDRKIRIPCNGDELSFERMSNLKRGRARCQTPEAQLQALVETPQEFHKEGLLMEVSDMNLLCCISPSCKCAGDTDIGPVHHNLSAIKIVLFS